MNIDVQSIGNERINELQEKFLYIYGKFDLDKAIIWMVEELGEVVQAIRKKKNKREIKEEIGDMVAWTINLCNILDIELAEAIESTVNKEIKRQINQYGKLKYVE